MHKIIVFISFVILLIFNFFLPTYPDKSFQLSIFVILAVNVISIYYFQKTTLKKYGYISFLTIFSLTYFIVFFQISLLNYFDIQVIESFFNFIWVNEKIVNKSLLFSAIGLISFYFGFIFYRKNIPVAQDLLTYIKVNKNSNFLIIFTFIFYFLFIVTSGSYKIGEYSPDDALFVSKFFFKYFNIFLTASIIHRLSYITSLSIGELSLINYLKLFDKSLLIILSWHLLFSLFVGDRGPVLSFSLLTFSIYFFRFKKIGIIKLITVSFILSILFTSIGSIRQSRYNGLSYIERIVSNINTEKENTKGFNSNVPGGSFVELAISVRTLNHVLYNVPEYYGYGYGVFSSSHFFNIVPGFSGLIMKILHNDDKKYDSSSAFISYLIQGDDPTYGDGTSIVADLYIDFGLFGVIIVLFLFGKFIGKNEFKFYFGYQRNSITWIALLIFFCFSAYLARSGLFLQLGKIITVYFIIYINDAMNSNHNRLKI